MPEPVQRRSALAAVYTEGVFGSGSGLTIHERHPMTLVDIGGDGTHRAFLASAEKAVGCPLPTHPNTTGSSGTLRVLWLSPKRWLCVDNADRLDGLDEFDVSDFPAAAVNIVSSGKTVLRLQGSRLRDVLAKGCPLDLHPKVFRPGDCAQTRAGNLNILIDHIDDDIFDIYVARGFAQTFWEWLTESALEYGYRVERPSGT